MLQSKQIEREQIEIRQELAQLADVAETEEQLGRIKELSKRWDANETRKGAAIIAEAEEKREAEREFPSNETHEWRDKILAYEVRQVALNLIDGSPLSGETAEVVQEMRQQGSYEGVPVPLELFGLEQRAGETIAANTPHPVKTNTPIDRLQPGTVVSKTGGQTINIPQGTLKYPVVSQGVTSGWADGELADVAAPQAFQTVDKSLSPDNTAGFQIVFSRQTLNQSGAAFEQVALRDGRTALTNLVDKAAFLGTGANGQPLGVVAGAATYSIDVNTVDAVASYDAFRTAAVEFMTRNAATSLSDINILMRPELINTLDDTFLETGSGITMWDIITRRFGNVVTTTNALDAPSGDPLESTAVMTTSTGGVPPFYVGVWGSGVDLIRDPYTKAPSGQICLTGLVTVDCTVARPEQIGILTGLQ